MPDLAALICARKLPAGHVLMHDGTQQLTLGDICDLESRIPRGLAATAHVALAPANAIELVRGLVLLDGKVSSIVLLPASMDERGRHDLAQTHNATIVDDVTDHVPWEKPIWPPQTCWSLVTSGTTGQPKPYGHTFASLTNGSTFSQPCDRQPVWGLLYDPCRFAGLQVLLHALAGGHCLIAPPADEDLPSRLRILLRGGCTHLSATPSLWRRILMHPGIDELQLLQVTLGGEAADQPLLDRLQRVFPQARISHTYASTEAGVGFSVHDGLAGFPSSWLNGGKRTVDLEIREGLLWIRPPAPVSVESRDGLMDPAGYICTHDRVRRDGTRVFFLGRDGSVVNVGGVKVHPEVVEDTIRRHPAVRECAVRARPSPMLGHILVAEVVAGRRAESLDPSIAREVKRWCREHLPREACPAIVTIVDQIALGPAGKLQRGISA